MSALRIASCLLFAALCARAQEPSYGISVPLTLSGDALYTHTYPAGDYKSNSLSAGFRGVLSPSVRLGAHWFLYAALEAHSSSYYSYQSGLDQDEFIRLNPLQAFLGYTTTIRKATLLIKAGQLSSAFGSFPVEYDDAKTAFPLPPATYFTPMLMRPDQLPCGVRDVLALGYADEINFHCGGSSADAYGLLPVTLYGLPGLESEISAGHIDARLQLTNSSPANPQLLTSGSQFLQWTAGGGYSVAGLRIGMSAYRGPYLDRVVEPFLPAGQSVRNFPASALGVDAQWARDRWSAEGEWQQFRFDLPGFTISPSERVAYAQLKAILSPRTYVAVRASSIVPGGLEDTSGVEARLFMWPQQTYEFGFGYRPNRYQLLKTAYAWTNRSPWYTNNRYWPQDQANGLEIQLVTTLTAFSRAFR